MVESTSKPENYSSELSVILIVREHFLIVSQRTLSTERKRYSGKTSGECLSRSLIWSYYSRYTYRFWLLQWKSSFKKRYPKLIVVSENQAAPVATTHREFQSVRVQLSTLGEGDLLMKPCEFFRSFQLNGNGK